MAANRPEIVRPEGGEVIQVCAGGGFEVPDRPIIPQIVGDGIGADISRAMVEVVDAAVGRAFGGRRKIMWMPVPAGEDAFARHGSYLPDETMNAIRACRVAIKGPLTTPIGGGIRSLNVHLRQAFDLYACIRPVRWFRGVPSPVKHPERVNIVIFRENTEDIYKGIEWPAESAESRRLIDVLKNELGKDVREDSAIGIKPMSAFGSKRLVRMAIRHAIERRLPVVTLIHKGNIMKFTEGAFRDWGYEVAREEFADATITEAEVFEKHGGKKPAGKILINDRIADSAFQQLLLRPEEYSVLATPNLNGDYLSDAAAAQVGGLGMAPGANIGEGIAIFEATHGTAPKYAGKDMVNPCSLILSAAMMLEAMGWADAASLIVRGIESAITARTVTYDLERQIEGATRLSTSQFGRAVIDYISRF
ncbi:isocitrate dehydrogenase (NADP(+)) [bacterium]|nr:isocitrate dehydrogenase (NADP(+)) [bacterium]